MKTTQKKDISITADSQKGINEPFIIKSREELPEWIRNLAIDGPPPPDFDAKAEYLKYLEEKYWK